MVISALPISASAVKKSKDPIIYYDAGVKDSITSELSNQIEKADDNTLISVIIWLKEPSSVRKASERLATLSGGDNLEPMEFAAIMSDEEYARRKELSINDYDAFEEESRNSAQRNALIVPSLNGQKDIEDRESERMDIIEDIMAEIDANSQDAFKDIQAVLQNNIKSAVKQLDSGVGNSSASKSEASDITYVSDFVPIMYANLTKSQIQAICEVDSVEYIDYFENMPLENTLSGALSVAQSTAIKNNYGYTGSGVKIGLIETNYPSSTYATKVTNTNADPLGTNTHANVTSDVIKQAAPGSTRYATIAPNTAQIVPAAALLVNKGCKIINMSLGGNFSGGIYSQYTKLIDYIVSTYGVTFVTTTGNKVTPNEPDDPVVTDYALSYNAIVVGGYNTNSIAFDDRTYRYERDEDTRYAPDIMAPGTSISAGGQTNYYGSSFAAPIVTASLAQIAQASDLTVTNPALAKALALASCYRSLPNDDTWGNDLVERNDAFSQLQGAGRFNALYAADMLRNGRCLSWGSSTFSSGYTYEKTVNVTSSDLVLRVALAWTQPTSSQTGSNVSGGLRDFDLELIAPNGETVASSDGANNTAELINYSVAGATGQYTIKLTYYGGGNGAGRLALAWW